jgi:tetratricopeptide (TPR) repeat protein
MGISHKNGIHRRMIRIRTGLLAAAVLLPVFVSGCRSEHAYYMVGSREEKQELATLFRLLEQEPESSSNMVVLIEQIAGYLYQAGHPEKMTVFLTSRIADNPDDPYNAYYLLLIAQHYKSTDSAPVARHYFSRVISNYADLNVRGESVHYTALRELAVLSTEDEARLQYYKDLLQRFPERIDKGLTYFYLARTYERLGEWDSAFKAYAEFLRYPETKIPGYPDAHREIQTKVNFYNSKRDWTQESLDGLVDDIKAALWRQNPTMLLRHRAKENFFAMSWEQEESDYNSQIMFNLGIFLQRSRVRYSNTLDISSNAREAYLRTWGWSHRIGTWYLYFRRVDFPADPEVHNNWEWAGIYFGEAL